ncbi:MAG: hypothetical protein IT359_10515 [Gemmatimonadaceae bacterium]|nr:hypothetical protein [Gemmatimonadaceae bacterium]
MRPTLAGLSLALLVLLGCKVENALDFHTTPPPPPRGYAVLVDVSALRSRAASATPNSNFADALSIVRLVDSLMTPHLELAALALDNAATHTVTQPYDYWTWPFDVTRGGVHYTGKLLGGRQGTFNAFRLAISSTNASPPFANFTLLNGQLDYLSTQGRWYVYDLKSSATDPVLGIAWVKTNTGVQIAIERPQELYGYEINGGVHALRRMGNLPADAFSLIWTPADGAGKVSLGSADYRCWDAQQRNVAC